MKNQTEERAVILGEYILENRATVRAAAKKFGISKSTVHKDVRDILEINKQERHIRGGLATKKKYMEIAEKKSLEKYFSSVRESERLCTGEV